MKGKKHTDERVARELLAQRIRHQRERMGLTQEQLAPRVGLSRPAIANIEAARQGVTLSAGVVIARALGGTLEQLVRGI